MRNELTPSTVVNIWPPTLVLEVALGIDSMETILEKHGITWAAWHHIEAIPAFRIELSHQLKELRENGLGFQAKARVQAESYLTELHRIVQNTAGDATAAQRLDAIKCAVKWGGLEPKESKDGGIGGNQFNIQINVG